MPERDVTFSVTAKDNTSAAVRSAASGVDNLGDKADKAQRKVGELGDETGHLARKLLEAKAAATLLARQLDKTGDTKLLKDFEKINREAARLGRAVKSIHLDTPKVDASSLVAEGAKAGKLFGGAAINSVQDLFAAIPGNVKGAIAAGLIGAAVIAAPGIAAAVEGAVLVGVGGGAIAAGLVLAARDPKVAQTYSELGSSISRELQQAAQPFVSELMAAAPALGTAFERELPAIRGILATASTAVGPLLRGVTGFAHALLPGIQAATAASMPLIRALAGSLPALGNAVSNLLAGISRGGPAAQAALSGIVSQLITIINALAMAAAAAAPFLNALAKAGDLLGVADSHSGRIGVLSDTIGKAGGQASLTATQYGMLSGAIRSTVAQADALNESFNRLFSEQMAVDQANLAVNVGMSNLTETIKGNKKTLDEHTESGQQNAGVILQQIQALDAKRQADIAAGNGTVEATQKANAAYASNVAALRAVLVQLGLAPAAVDALIAAYASIPRDITTTVTTRFRTTGTPPPGYGDALAGHSRTGANDMGGNVGWAPATFASGNSVRAAADGGGARTGGPVALHSEVDVMVNLDGKPFRAMTAQVVAAAGERRAWRDKVGPR